MQIIFKSFIIILVLLNTVQAEECYKWIQRNNVEKNGWPLNQNTGCLQNVICEDVIDPYHPCHYLKNCPESANSLYKRYNDRLSEAYANLSGTATLPNIITLEELEKRSISLFDIIYLVFVSDFEIEALTYDGYKTLLTGWKAYEHARRIEFKNACPISTNDFISEPQQPGLKAFFNKVYKITHSSQVRSSKNKLRVTGIADSVCKEFPNACQLVKQLVNALSRHNKFASSELNQITKNFLVAVQNGYSVKRQQEIKKHVRDFDTRTILRDNQRQALWLKILELFGIDNGKYIWADFNKDNKEDYAFKSGSIIEVYLSSNNNSFRQTASLNVGHSDFSVASIDFDRNNKLDLKAVADSNLPEDDVYFKGLGNGTFQKNSENPCEDKNLNDIPDCDENICNNSSCFSGGISGYLAPKIAANVSVRDADSGSNYKVANQLKAFFVELRDNVASSDALLFVTTVPKAPRTPYEYSPNGNLYGEQNFNDWGISVNAKNPTANSSYLLTISLAEPPSDRNNPASKYEVQVAFGIDRALEYRKKFLVNNLNQKILCLVKRNKLANQSFVWGVSCSLS